MTGRTYQPARAASLLLGALVAVLALVWAGPARAQKPAAPAQTAAKPTPKTPPVVASILPAAQGVYRVSILFPGAAGKARAQAAVSDLIRRSGWQAGQMQWTEAPAEGRFPARISASFLVSTVFPNGQFPVEAFALAFRQFGEVNVMFFHGGTFQYRGKPHYENADVAIDAAPGPTSLTLHIVVKNPKIERVDLAPPLPAPTAPVKRGPGGLPAAAWVLIALLGAALAWVIVFVLMGGKQAARPRR